MLLHSSIENLIIRYVQLDIAILFTRNWMTGKIADDEMSTRILKM